MRNYCKYRVPARAILPAIRSLCSRCVYSNARNVPKSCRSNCFYLLDYIELIIEQWTVETWLSNCKLHSRFKRHIILKSTKHNRLTLLKCTYKIFLTRYPLFHLFHDANLTMNNCNIHHKITWSTPNIQSYEIRDTRLRRPLFGNTVVPPGKPLSVRSNDPERRSSPLPVKG